MTNVRVFYVMRVRFQKFGWNTPTFYSVTMIPQGMQGCRTPVPSWTHEAPVNVPVAMHYHNFLQWWRFLVCLISVVFDRCIDEMIGRGKTGAQVWEHFNPSFSKFICFFIPAKPTSTEESENQNWYYLVRIPIGGSKMYLLAHRVRQSIMYRMKWDRRVIFCSPPRTEGRFL